MLLLTFCLTGFFQHLVGFHFCAFYYSGARFLIILEPFWPLFQRYGQRTETPSRPRLHAGNSHPVCGKGGPSGWEILIYFIFLYIFYISPFCHLALYLFILFISHILIYFIFLIFRFSTILHYNHLFHFPVLYFLYFYTFYIFIFHFVTIWYYIYLFYFTALWAILVFRPGPRRAGARPGRAGRAAWGLRPGPWPRQQENQGLPRGQNPNAWKPLPKKSGQISRVAFERETGIRPGPGPRPGGWAGAGNAPGARTWGRGGPRPTPGPGPGPPRPIFEHLAVFTIFGHLTLYLFILFPMHEYIYIFYIFIFFIFLILLIFFIFFIFKV